MAAPAFVGAVETGADSNTVNVAAPDGVQVGDHQLVFIGAPGSSVSVTSVPSGWTLVREQPNTADATDFTLWCYASSTAGSSSASFTISTSTTITAVRVAYRGGSGVESSVGSSDGSSTSNHALATATTTVADSTVVAAGYEDSGSSTKTHSMGDGWVERADYVTGDLSRRGMIAVYDIVKSTPGTQGGTIVSSAADYIATISVVLTGDTTPPEPPGSVFDLANWKITLPTEDPEDPGDADEVRQPELDTYADQHFYLDGSDRMVMVAPTSGPNIETTGGSSASRCELREMQGENEAAWSIFDAEPRSLTVTGTFDPTSITGGSNPRKEMIIGQIHGPLGNPPIYLAAEFHVATPRVRVYKYNGSSTPGFGNMLEGLTPSSTITYRIEYDPGADPVNGTGRINIYGAFGTVDNLPTEPDFAFAPGDFFNQTDEWYFKAGAYNKTTVDSGSSGSAIATISYLELVQPAGGTAHERTGAAAALPAGAGGGQFDPHAEHELTGASAALVTPIGALEFDPHADHHLTGGVAPLAGATGVLEFDAHAEHPVDGHGAVLAGGAGALQFDEHTEHPRAGAAAALAAGRGSVATQGASTYEFDGAAAALIAGAGVLQFDAHEVVDRAGAAAALAAAAGAVELDTVNVFDRSAAAGALAAGTGEGDLARDRSGAAGALAAGTGAAVVSPAAVHERAGAGVALAAGAGLGSRSTAARVERAGGAAALVGGSGTVTVTGPTTYERAGAAAAVPAGSGQKERARSYEGGAAAIPAGTGAADVLPPSVHVRGGDGAALAVGTGVVELVEHTRIDRAGDAAALGGAVGARQVDTPDLVDRAGGAAALGAATAAVELTPAAVHERAGAGVALALGHGFYRIGGRLRAGQPYRVGSHHGGVPYRAGSYHAGATYARGQR